MKSSFPNAERTRCIPKAHSSLLPASSDCINTYFDVCLLHGYLCMEAAGLAQGPLHICLTMRSLLFPYLFHFQVLSLAINLII